MIRCPQCGKLSRGLVRAFWTSLVLFLALAGGIAAVYVSGHHIEFTPVEKGE